MFQFITWLFIKVIASLPHSWRQPHFPFATSSRFYQPSEYFHHVSQAILRSIILNPVARLFQLISITRLPGCATKGANWLPFPSPSFRPTRLLGSSSAFPSRVLLLLSSVSSTRIAASSEFPSRALLPNSLHGSCDFCSIPFSGLLLLHSLLGSASSAFPSWVPSRVCFFFIPFLGLLLLHSHHGTAFVRFVSFRPSRLLGSSSAFLSRVCLYFRPSRLLGSSAVLLYAPVTFFSSRDIRCFISWKIITIVSQACSWWSHSLGSLCAEVRIPFAGPAILPSVYYHPLHGYWYVLLSSVSHVDSSCFTATCIFYFRPSLTSHLTAASAGRLSITSPKLAAEGATLQLGRLPPLHLSFHRFICPVVRSVNNR